MATSKRKVPLKEKVPDRDMFIGMCALYCHLAKMEGNKIDKKSMRYNDMYDYAVLCGLQAEMRDVLSECVLSCIEGSDFHLPGKTVMHGHGWMVDKPQLRRNT